VDPLVGTTVAHYDVVARLGGGGMGVVYAARDTKLGRRVALKFLPPQWSHDESAKQRFMREAQAASATDHPNICTIHDIASTGDGQLFIVMAHYDGETLKSRLERGRLPVDEAMDVAAQVAEGLAKAHSQGVVHRDIKPGNLMLTEHGVRILDFGLAKFADARLKLTLEGSTIGTIAYMSPEQARGEEADARSDVWAVGVVLYEMLTGEVPFRGGYPEAIAHAIKNDPPAPIRTRVPDVPEALEQLVFRALHKDPAVRLQSARDLARALRLLQGRSIPLDLRTEPLPAGEMIRPGAGVTRRRWTSRKMAVAAVALLAVVVGAPAWVFSPVERIPVAVAPVVNQTGYSELDAYRMALTEELTAALAESPTVRPVSYDRLLQIVRPFRRAGNDVSSRETLQAVAKQSGAQIIVVPTLLNENNAWRARVELRNPATATNLATYETDGIVSSLMKDSALRLVEPLTAQIEGHFTRTRWRRGYVADLARNLFGAGNAPLTTPIPTLDAAAAFEQGLDAYEQQEHTAALRAFTTAAQLEPRNPLPFVWRSRVARIMRLDGDAAEAAAEAARLVSDQTPARIRLFVQAVAAESRGDAAAAETLYRQLVAQDPDDVLWRSELAAFMDRQSRPAEAVDLYHEVLNADARLARPRLELCRLYGPLRLNDTPNATEHGQAALKGYQELGHRAGEAQALWCLMDVLGLGGDTERAEAVRHADAALRIFTDLGYEYNLSRAFNYAALAATRQGRLTEAASFWEQALVAARQAGNAGLEPQILANLGATYLNLSDPMKAVERFQQAHALFESLRDDQRAAQTQANAASLIVDFGGDLETASRDIQNALAVFQKRGDKNFEVFSLQVIGEYHRNAGRYADATRELNRSLAIARERELTNRIGSVSIALARSHFEDGGYEAAAKLLTDLVRNGSGAVLTQARIQLGRTLARRGDLDAAAMHLKQAAADLEKDVDPTLDGVMHLATGEVAYESGRLADARTAFAAGAALWKSNFPDPASVEARAALGLVDGLQGRTAPGMTAIRISLDQAHRTGRFSLEHRCRVYLARIAVAARRFDEALRLLDEIPPDGTRAIGRELRAQVHYWRSAALRGRGDREGANTEAQAARTIIEALRAALSERDRARFAARPDIQVIVR